MAHHLVGMTEIAAMLGVSRQRVHQLTREDPTFPAPTVVISAGSVWERDSIEEWAERSGRRLFDERA